MQNKRGNQKINQVALSYYSRPDVQEAIFNFCKNRETVPRYNLDSFGKRPDTLQYKSEIFQLAKKGATSFHCSEEIWQNPLKLSIDLPSEQLNELRTGWDLILDIDSKYLDYSKIACSLLIQALEFHNVKNIGIKFSGSKGFHIVVPWKAFPEHANQKQTKDMFPEWPRAISIYLNNLIKPKLIEKIRDLGKEKFFIKGDEEIGDFAEKVAPDIILVSSRHLFRCPYSLHEKTALASIVLDKSEIEGFKITDADPLKLKIKNFYPVPEQNEARELLLQALDYAKIKQKSEKREFKEIKINKRKLVLPPAIEKILKGLHDGKKRALFILLNFFKSLNFDKEEIEAKIEEWNKKNKPPLPQGYINSQLTWTFRQPKILPPNYDKDYYKGIGIVPTDEELKYKNPVNYTVKKSRK